MKPQAAALPAPWATRRVAIPRTLEDLELPEPGSTLRRLSGETMGTTWSLSAICSPAVDDAALRRELIACVDRVVTEMSTWVASSDLSRFNRSAGEWQPLPDWFFTVLTCALDVARDSGGAYDPTVGPLVNLWGFGPEPRRGAAPSAAAIGTARAHAHWARIEIDRAGRRARQPGGMYVDLSAIAKGFAVDAVAGHVEGLGVGSYLVEIGGELRGRGVKADGHPWWVSVETPGGAGAPAVDLVIALHDLSIATSGDYRRGFSEGGRWYSHTIDPRSGRPVEHGLSSVSVLHRDCVMADALSTALMVLGPREGLAFAEARDLAALFVTRTAGGAAPIATPALEALLR
jgi:FAD:protein FMN transferase